MTRFSGDLTTTEQSPMAKATKQPPEQPAETQAEYRQRIMDIVCGCLIEGKSLEEICHADIEGMPKRSGTIREWCCEDAALATMYARARELQADSLLETLAPRFKQMVKNYLNEGWEPKDAISAAKGEIDAEKWRMQRMFPRKCGDKIEQTLTGEVTVFSKIERTVVKPQ